MDNSSIYIGIIFGIAYLFFSIKTQVAIVKSSYLSKNQKTLNSILIWALPFIWAFLIKSFIKQDNSGVMTKNKRKTNKSHFYESKKGFYGSFH